MDYNYLTLVEQQFCFNCLDFNKDFKKIDKKVPKNLIDNTKVIKGMDKGKWIKASPLL